MDKKAVIKKGTEISFVGTMDDDGKEVEIHFKTTTDLISIEHDSNRIPRITIYPTKIEDSDIYIQLVSN